MKEKLKIVRPVNLVIVALTMFIVLLKFRSETVSLYWACAVLLILPAMLTAAAGYVINDIFDVETDKINKPHMLTVGQTISRKNAWILYGILVAISLSISWVFSWFFNHSNPDDTHSGNTILYFIVNLAITVLLAAYAVKLKGAPLIGNVVVASCSASVIAVCLFIASFDAMSGAVNFFGYIIFAFFTSLIREIVKDLQDMEGDRALGLRTYAIVMGEKGAKILVYVLVSIQILMCGLYSIITWGIGMHACAVIMGVITLTLFYFINNVANAKTQAGYLQSSRLMKYIMVAGVINLFFS